MKPLCEEMRLEIVLARHSGTRSAEVAERYGVSRRTVSRLYRQFKRSGYVQPKKIGGYRRSKLEPHLRIIARWIRSERGFTMAQLQKRCQAELGVKIGLNALWKQVQRLKRNARLNEELMKAFLNSRRNRAAISDSARNREEIPGSK